MQASRWASTSTSDTVSSGMINGGFTERLSGRLSFNTEFGDGGPQDNLFTGEDHGKPDLYDVRGQLLWEGDAPDRPRARPRRRRPQRESGLEGARASSTSVHRAYCPQALSGETLTRPSACSKFAGFATLEGFPEGEFEPDGRVHDQPEHAAQRGRHVLWRLPAPRVRHGRGQLTSITAAEYYERIHREDSQSDIFNSTSTHYYNEMQPVHAGAAPERGHRRPLALHRRSSSTSTTTSTRSTART